MSNCYDHSIKKDMMDSYTWNSKEEAKANVLQNYKELRQWYEEYTGGTWEENNED